MTDPVSISEASRSTDLPRREWTRWLVIAALLIPVGLILIAFGSRLTGRGESSSGFGVNSVGQLGPWKIRPAPAVTLHYYDGSQGPLVDSQAPVTVLNFWGSWCAPCRQEAPILEQVAKAGADQGVRFVGINLWDNEGDAHRFLQQYQVTYRNAPDPSGKLAIEFGVFGIPETYFIDAQGQIVQRWVGPLTEDRLWALIDQVRAPSPTTTAAVIGVAR